MAQDELTLDEELDIGELVTSWERVRYRCDDSILHRYAGRHNSNIGTYRGKIAPYRSTIGDFSVIVGVTDPGHGRPPNQLFIRCEYNPLNAQDSGNLGEHIGDKETGRLADLYRKAVAYYDASYEMNEQDRERFRTDALSRARGLLETKSLSK